MSSHRKFDGTGFSTHQFKLAYPKGIEHHYWNHGRNKIILRKLLPFVKKTDILFDIGCGSGITVDFLRKAGLNCHGCEIADVLPLSESIAPFFYSNTDAFTLTGDLREQCKVILLLDVLEHLENPGEFVRTCTTYSPNLNLLIITLPAHKELWSNYDEYYGHFTRYDLDGVESLFEKTEFQLLEAGYFFHALYLPMRLICLLGKEGSTEIHPPRLPIFHRLLSSFFSMEEALIPSFVPGTSLYIILKAAIPQ